MLRTGSHTFGQLEGNISPPSHVQVLHREFTACWIALQPYRAHTGHAAPGTVVRRVSGDTTSSPDGFEALQRGHAKCVGLR